jgi:hypothetical protein
MCAAALQQCRIDRLVYGARNHLLGGHGSWINILSAPAHRIDDAAEKVSKAIVEKEATMRECSSEQDACTLQPSMRSPRHPFHPELKVQPGSGSVGRHHRCFCMVAALQLHAWCEVEHWGKESDHCPQQHVPNTVVIVACQRRDDVRCRLTVDCVRTSAPASCGHSSERGDAKLRWNGELIIAGGVL